METRSFARETPFTLSRSAVFRHRSADDVEVTLEGRSGTMSLSLYQLALRFSSPRTVREVHADCARTESLESTEETLRPLVECGLLAADRSSSERSIEAFLHRATFADATLLHRVGRAVGEGRAVAIPNALDPAFAEEVYTDLAASSAWTPNERAPSSEPFEYRHDNFFHYRHRNIFEVAHLPACAIELRSALGSVATKAHMTSVVGVDCTGPLEFAASEYLPGDYSLPHLDVGGGRSIAYVWYLTKDWRAEWGGDFVWCPTGAVVSPSFNTLVLFRVDARSLHFVSPVSPRAQGRRMAINGWWRESTVQPTRLESSRWPLPLAPGSYGGGTRLLEGRDDVVVL